MTVQTLQDTIFSTLKTSLNLYYIRNSYNQLSFDQSNSRFFDWKMIDADSTSCNPDDWASKANPTGVDLTKFDHIIYVFPQVTQCLGSSIPRPSIPKELGFADLPGKRVFINASPTIGTLAHELGHNFGLAHANLWDCGKESINDRLILNPCQSIELGDFFDAMGSSESALSTGPFLDIPFFDTPHKIALGWIPRKFVQTVKQS